MSRRAILLLATVALVLVGNVPVARAAVATPFHVQGSVEQVAVTGAEQGSTAQLLAADQVIAKRPVDRQGATLFRHVTPGTDYRVQISGERSGAVTVTSPSDIPDRSVYSSQQIDPGFGYIKTRDGTLLSANVSLPGPVEDGPYPTVVEYSGYDPSNPGGRQPASGIAQILGYATVGVNLRGTGCSGGAFEYFEPLQSLDGYDVVEAVAAQPWVANGAVGMVGISYPALTQLWVAATRPPHLAAITPLSPIDDTHGVVYPGAILNNGFAVPWAEDRQADARPSANRWVEKRIANDDKTCAANQDLRLQSTDVHRQIAALGPDRVPADDALAPATFVDQINVPVFIAGTWQDEETGGHFPHMLNNFAPGIVVKATLMNGVHADAFGPEVVTRWAEFLDFYVARRVPSIPLTTRAIASALFAAAYGTSITLPPDRFDPSTDYATALASYEAEPPVRVLFDNGAGPPAGAPISGVETNLPSWPPPTTAATTWYFQPDGALGTTAPDAKRTDQFAYDPSVFPRTDAPDDTDDDNDDGGFASAPKYDWKPLPRGKAVAYVTAPLTADTVLLGTGSVDLWLRSTAPDVDLEVTVSEVRPDGQETYVQSGWLRTSFRTLDGPASTALNPVPTYAKRDVKPLPKEKLSLVRVPLFPFGHAFRAGSRIRIAVQPPGGNRPAWAFQALEYPKPQTVEIALGGDRASRAVLPVFSGVDVPVPLPACDSLRGQPCRDYEAAANGAER